VRPDKERYRELRKLSREKLWPLTDEFKSRPETALIRAVGVAFAEHDTEKARDWVRPLLRDGDEKIRRYAINAWPKLRGDEGELLSVLKAASTDREREALHDALEKIGGAGALQIVGSQRIRARIENAGVIRMDRVFNPAKEIIIHLRCRSGLEGILSDEVKAQGRFEIIETRQADVKIAARNFSLRLLYELRCFAIAGFTLPAKNDLAETISGSREILEAFTEGSVTYRIDFVRKGHQRAVVKDLADKVFAKCPRLLNSPSQAAWTIAILGNSVEARPRLVPDPRFAYRADDVAAASHPPLAAAMARLAGPFKDEVVWDPFCGSGLELIERARLSGVKKLIGTDLSAEAIEISKKNLAAGAPAVESVFLQTDFREAKDISPTLIITNPPLGKRVPIPDLKKLFEELFATVGKILPRGGRFVLVNPLRLPAPAGMKMVFQQVVDMGGFNCQLEKYVK
jgi:23S rRNA G2445 N2-methylase RlmL